LPDEPGFITPRVISMIINEAYFALEEGVSTKEEINTAMKLGTAYPYGPFEWAERIGVRNILVLLNRLSKEKSQYKPAPLLVEEALTAKA
jgi:3-hydroxybutyryl-CoA dehydrogenase